jgi:signal transduction histidine kinase
MDPDFDRLMLGRFPELADALERREESIVRRWEEHLVKLIPHAEKMTLQQVRDDVPPMLEWISASLRSGAAAPLEYLQRHSATHGGVRYHQNFDLNEVIVEYHLLRRVMIEEVINALGRQLDVNENIALNLGLDITLRKAAVEFANHQAAQLRAGAEAHAKYLAFLSHDLRGGLNGVLLMIEVLRRDLQNHTQFTQSLEDLDVMKQSILDTVATMERFLHSERLRSGLFVLKRERIDINHFIRDLCHQFAYQARAKGITLVPEAPTGFSVITDREVLSMILRNLVSNAVKYTPRGKVTVRVETRRNDGGGPRITVADEGPGMTQEQLGKLFAPFTRGETHGQSGVGLGLSIARQGAELLQARLSVESEVGKGATFYLELPE